jgi:Xanthosine triphosphate pyrophosphatase
MTSLIFATNNRHKVEEIQAAIGHMLRVVSLKEAGIEKDIPEPFDTLEENAREKSRVIHELTGQNCFSEDTGLEVEALNGEPGVKSARYAGEDKDFNANMVKLLSRLGATTNRRARFRTVISLIWQGKEYLFEGILPRYHFDRTAWATRLWLRPGVCARWQRPEFCGNDPGGKEQVQPSKEGGR